MTDRGGFDAARNAMVDALDLRDRAVAAAMRRVPRHAFLPDKRWAEAYEDEPVPLGPDETTVSAPHMVALQLESARVGPGDHALELGTGMGYLAALLAELVGPSGRVDSVEVEPYLVAEARRRLSDLGYAPRVTVHAGDGTPGLPGRAPFDQILVSYATPQLETAWQGQLREGGRLVAPVGGRWEQRLLTYARVGASGTTTRGPACRFVARRSALRRDI
jgi:protein-L-isoaspartate(D-aspartate) O-methyltransferase